MKATTEQLFYLKSHLELTTSEVGQLFSLQEGDLKLLELGLSPEEHALLKQKVAELKKLLAKFKKKLQPQEIIDLFRSQQETSIV